MHSDTIDVQTPDGTADCYLTRPSDEKPHPAVLLMIDAIGLRPRIEEMADRIARDGYVVLAPNVFYRAGRAPLWETPDFADADARAQFMQSLGPVMAELTADRVAADGGAYLGRLAELSDGPVGITGYCFGGRLGWTIAASHPDRVAALGGFHTGRMVTDTDDSPHLLAPSVTAEVYWGHADQDQSMSPEHIATLDRAMDEAGVRHTTELYEGAAHGYTMSDMAVFNEAACERHFEALDALLGRTLETV
ncbi:MAG TPA: dienelactone hydrolase family protein [Solirubrobacteraceae bacterium]|jgi:carboxymethylenebutenolidase|nr:dienelactone hydrolase family protein [Solirubrobacteraceae bacterium]